MTENKIRTLIFSLGATVNWLFLAYMIVVYKLPVGSIIGVVLIGLALTIVSMGQGE